MTSKTSKLKCKSQRPFDAGQYCQKKEGHKGAHYLQWTDKMGRRASSTWWER